MLAMRGMTGNLDRDDVLSHIVPVVSAERHPGNPGARGGSSQRAGTQLSCGCNRRQITAAGQV
jgi:hypothetical protein